MSLRKINLFSVKISYILNWVFLSKIGSSRIVQSFPIWITLVPTLVYFVDIFPDQINLMILGNKIPLEMKLPFNLVVFYFSSLFFGCANILYHIKCPDLIKNYNKNNLEKKPYENIKNIQITHSKIRLFISICYLIGFSVISLTLIKNIWLTVDFLL